MLFSVLVHERGEKIRHAISILLSVVAMLLISCLHSSFREALVTYLDTIKLFIYGTSSGESLGNHGASYLIRNVIIFINAILRNVMRGIFIYAVILVIKQVKPIILKVLFSLFLIWLTAFWIKDNLHLRIDNVEPFLIGFVVILLNSFFTLSDGKVYFSSTMGKFVKENKQLFWLIGLFIILPTVNSIESTYIEENSSSIFRYIFTG